MKILTSTIVIGEEKDSVEFGGSSGDFSLQYGTGEDGANASMKGRLREGILI
jgi:hypothetical protein